MDVPALGASSTRTVAALTSPKNTRWMQPCMNATVPRLTGALDSRFSGSRRTAARGEAGGASERMDFSRAPGISGASRGASLEPGTSSRSRPGCVNSAKIALRYARSFHERASLRSICGRVRSISLSYCTPDGQAVTHAMQPRQRSKCVTISGEITEPSS